MAENTISNCNSRPFYYKITKITYNNNFSPAGKTKLRLPIVYYDDGFLENR